VEISGGVQSNQQAVIGVVRVREKCSAIHKEQDSKLRVRGQAVQ